MTAEHISLFPELDEEAKILADKAVAAKPFLSWLGGKTQLLHAIRAYYPNATGVNDADVYVEPFVGGGAVFFDIMRTHDFKTVVINDFDPNPVNCYRLVRDNVEEYIQAIQAEQALFESKDYGQQSAYYYQCRDEFNALKDLSSDVDRLRKAVLAIFLNRVSFNSLYRMNAKGEMNASWSKGLKKFSVDFQNMRKVSTLLNENNVIIENTSYENLSHYFTDKTFAFFDPPYRALTKTANFNKYGNTASQEKWDDAAQLRLRDFMDTHVDSVGAKFLLTNSDPKNSNVDDEFFEDAYRRYDIDRVDARRNISVTNSGRAAVKELFISNIPSSLD